MFNFTHPKHCIANKKELLYKKDERFSVTLNFALKSEAQKS